MVRLSGSTTLLPLAQEGADMFMENSPGERVVVQGGGSSVVYSPTQAGIVKSPAARASSNPVRDDGTFRRLQGGPGHHRHRSQSEERHRRSQQGPGPGDLLPGMITNWSEVGEKTRTSWWWCVDQALGHAPDVRRKGLEQEDRGQLRDRVQLQWYRA